VYFRQCFSRALMVWGCAVSFQFACAQLLQLPTANHTLFEKDGEARFFTGTVGKPWTTGCFGCVRSDGMQLHEGLDISCLHRDKRGEPTDPVAATADGEVVYINQRPSLSNYGNYIVLRHRIDGLEIYSLYAHLSRVREGLKPGQQIKTGEVIATMGRTSNTHEGISKDRAHVHYELDLFGNDQFASWYKKTFPTQRNDHGLWNGQNLTGLDPQAVLMGQQSRGTNFSLLQFIRTQTPLCRVLVRKTDFSWLKRYPQLVRVNPVAQKEGVAGYEIALNFNALPFELIPRAASEIKGKATIQLLSVNIAEQQKNSCCKLVTNRRGRWELTEHGLNDVKLLTF
jgi:murein DD-endopeptidase MepM/ murein hydrolase activator NlpD